jgi:spore germination protein YaaH
MNRTVLSLSKVSAAGMLALTLFTTLIPAAQAASNNQIEITGWIPYWATAQGTADAQAHISQVTEINPFGYSVKTDGTLADTANIQNSAWQSLFQSAHAKGVKVVPTIMWSDTANIYAVLSNPALRANHVQGIVQAVQQNGFDGVDIDYEGKTAETRDGYSAFLTELSSALYKANTHLTLDCTIEARMPLSARYSGTPPANIEYANDLPTINKVCDRVRLMTYDQQTADIQLNNSHSSELYAPLADTAWVEKVVNYMENDITPSKILIGVASYGAEYQAMSNLDGSGFTYTKTSAFNPKYATELAKQLGITPSRNSAGELYFSYVDPNQTAALPSNSILSALAPNGTSSGGLAAAGALAFSKQQAKQAPVTFVTWSDSVAIAAKATLAQKLGVAGIALFKVDGGEDPNTWNALANVASPVINPATSRSITIDAASSTPSSSGTTGTSTVTTVPTSTNTGTTQTTANTNSGTSSFKKDLRYGATGTDVTKLQNILIKKGYLKVKANGVFGPATRTAVKVWQKAVGLPATGFFGPMSRAKIGN